MAEPEQPNRLLSEHFEHQPFSAHSSRWDSLWKDQWTPWDRAGPSMALSDLLKERADLVDNFIGNKRALVPGCGRGHDVLLLASFGFDAWGLDVSDVAIDEARRNAAVTSGLDILNRSGKSHGPVHWVSGDFFQDDWVPASGVGEGKFDLIFDYTFFCALPPSARPAWAKRMVDLLAPQGKLVCLEFPSTKHSSEPGPPWAAPPHSYVAYLGRPGHEPVTDEYGGVIEDKIEEPDGGLSRILHTRPRRTHAAGVSDGLIVDYISVWEHR